MVKRWEEQDARIQDASVQDGRMKPHARPKAGARLRSLISGAGSRGGNVLIEFALIAPILVTLLMGAADYGLETYYNAQLLQAVRAGAEYVKNTGYSTDVAGIDAAITGASGLTGLTIASPSGANSGVTYQCASGQTFTSPVGAVCADGSAVGSYMTISASYSYTSFTAYFSSGTRTLTSTDTVRFQ